MIILLLILALGLSLIVNLYLWDRLVGSQQIIKFYKTTCGIH